MCYMTFHLKILQKYGSELLDEMDLLSDDKYFNYLKVCFDNSACIGTNTVSSMSSENEKEKMVS